MPFAPWGVMHLAGALTGVLGAGGRWAGWFSVGPPCASYGAQQPLWPLDASGIAQL